MVPKCSYNKHSFCEKIPTFTNCRYSTVFLQVIYFVSTHSYCDYMYKKLAPKYYSYKRWLGLGSCEEPPQSSSQAANLYILYVFVLIEYANQETFVGNSVYKIIRRIIISRVTNYQNTRCLLFV